MNNSYGRDLAEMWRASSRDYSLKFLKETVGANLTLGDLIKVLDFEHIRGNLHSIRLRDILERPEPISASASTTTSALPSAGAKVMTLPAPRRRNKTRRDRQQTASIEETVRKALQAAPGHLATDQLTQQVRDTLGEVPPATVALILKGLERQGDILGDRSRPRRWRLKVQGRRVPEPIVIRKAAAQEPAIVAAVQAVPDPAPSPGGSGEAEPVALMTQAEIQAAAARLRERFFATSKG